MYVVLVVVVVAVTVERLSSESTIDYFMACTNSLIEEGKLYS